MDETFVLDCIEKYKPGLDEIAFDIGANRGIYSKVLAQKFCHVYAFEPFETNIATILQDTQDIPNLTVVGAAISRKTGPVRLYINESNSGGHSISPKIAKAEKYGHRKNNHIEVDGITIDDFCKMHGVWPGFIKMDIEGAENFVWDGAGVLLEQIRPRIVLETHQTLDCKKLWTFFADLGYRAWGENRKRARVFEPDKHYLLYHRKSQE